MSPPCRLLTALPAEIRNTIYDLVAADATLDIFIQDEAIQAVPLSASLSRTCRQLRAESLPIYLDTAKRTSSFVIHNQNLVNTSPSLTFLHSIAELQPGIDLRIRFVLNIDNIDETLRNLNEFVLTIGQEYEWIVESGCSVDIANSIDFAFNFRPSSPKLSAHSKDHDSLKERACNRIEELRKEMCRQNFCRRVQVQFVSERLAFQKIYHAFVRDAQAMDGVTESECNLRCWHRMDGSLCFV